MRYLLLCLLFVPSLSFAIAPNCRFSKLEAEHSAVTTNGCGEAHCSHVVVCNGTPSVAICKAKNGTCDNYDANECIASMKNNIADAEYNTEAPAADEGVGGR